MLTNANHILQFSLLYFKQKQPIKLKKLWTQKFAVAINICEQNFEQVVLIGEIAQHW